MRPLLHSSLLTGLLLFPLEICLAELGFVLTIGDTAFNFDAVTSIVSPAGTEVIIEFPDDVDSGERADGIRLKFTGFDPGQTVAFITDVDLDNNNSTEDYRRVLFNNGGAPNAVATAFGETSRCSVTLSDATDKSSYRFECSGSEPRNGELGFTFDILSSSNTPTFRVTNTSAGNLELTAFDVTIGDTDFNFDSVTDIVAPVGMGVAIESPDADDGGERDNRIRLAFAGFASGESMTFVVDVDDDDTTEDYRRVLFNNGDAPNAVATAFAGMESCSVALSDAADQSAYHFECGSTCSGLGVGLVAHYPLDGNTLDATGNGHDGLLFGAVPTPDREGNANGAYSFDGEDNYIGVPYSDDLQPSLLTLALWAQRDSWAAETFADDAALAGNTESGGFEFYIDRLAGELQGYARSRTGSYVLPSVSLADLAPGWHHFALTCDGVNTVLYVDGISVAADSTGDGSVHYSRANSLIVGEEASSGADPSGDNFAGRLDDVRVYGRALCPTEIRQLGRAGGFASFRIMRISRNRGTQAITLNWVPVVNSGTIERSVSLSAWETLEESVSGTAWTGKMPGDPGTTYLRVRGTVSEQ